MKQGQESQARGLPWFGRFGQSRSLWLEILAFVAVAIFAFSVVTTLLGDEENLLVQAVPEVVAGEVVDAPALYEAPSQRARAVTALSPIFTPSVQHWAPEIMAWSAEYGIDPNAAATLMQIESCGNPSARSWAGATGLFQVMPFHFADSEDAYDPATNAARGLAYFAQAMERANGHVGLAMAGYNGGLGMIDRNYATWPHETQRYYRWGTGVYREASAGWESSPTLSEWLDAGGRSLCEQAEAELGLR